jgi:hypothetical protein
MSSTGLPEAEDGLTPEEWGRWVVFGDPHHPPVVLMPWMRELVDRVALAVVQDRLDSDRIKRGAKP